MAVGVRVGGFHSMVLTRDGGVFTWGWGAYGQLGHGNTRDQILDAGGDMLGAVVTGRRFHIPRAIYRWL